MKKFMTGLLISLSLSSIAAEPPQFSAFSNGDKLYVTVLGDSCNTVIGSLAVDKSCDERRMTRNFAVSCNADLLVMSTELFCGDTSNSNPKVMEISLSEYYVAKEAKKLNLKYNGSIITVVLNQLEKPTQVEDNAKLIYDALDVVAINAAPGRFGAMSFVKSIGGLLCRFDYLVDRSEYSCSFLRVRDGKAVYNALNVPATDLNPGVTGVGRTGKLAGNLECVKELVIYPGAVPSYTCNFL